MDGVKDIDYITTTVHAMALEVFVQVVSVRGVNETDRCKD